MFRHGPAASLPVLLALGSLVCGPSSAGATSEPPSDSGPGSSSAPAEPDALEPPPPVDALPAEFPVGVRHMAIVDETRPTNEDLEQGITAADSRTLQLTVLYPAAGPTTEGPAVDGADPAEGRFPLVVFAHGYTDTVDLFIPLLVELSGAGYVVVAPSFPLTGASALGTSGTALGDYVNQPADVSFVISATLDGPGPLTFIADHVDGEHVGVGGHSLGAITTLGLVYNTCCHDDRIDAALVSAGSPTILPFADGEFDWAPVPLLLVHGDVDTTVGIDGSRASFDAATGPVHFLTLTGATHPDPILNPTYSVWWSRTAVGFFDAYFTDDPAALTALPADVDASGIGTWQERVA